MFYELFLQMKMLIFAKSIFAKSVKRLMSRLQ